MPESVPGRRAAGGHLDDLSKVLLIGSGPIIIGQAAEFDYSGTQACRALREAGLEVVLVNSNPATIMTDAEVADRVYIEPLIAEVVEQIIAAERPQGLLATMGGQTGLNLAIALHDRGVLERFGVRVLGTPIAAVEAAEDRALFKTAMAALGEPLPESETVASPDDAVAAALRIGLPVVVRPAFTLGGSGGGIAATPDEVRAIAHRGISLSRIGQVLVERSVAGWKEIEYEVLRDGAGNAITICNMENVDPMGVHTGDSIVVAPSQTLSDRTYHRLRTAALRIVRGLDIQGACNVQFALEAAPAAAGAPGAERYCVIEVNPRVSRSSALASKATGYPIARVATQIALGRRLDEITNAITGGTACFEPALDYVVVKIPRWPFDKFPGVERTLGTQMKSTGEAMALGRTFEEALLKGVRSLDGGAIGLWHPMVEAWSEGEVWARIRTPHEHRLFALPEALRRGAAVEALQAAGAIDAFFLEGIARIVAAERGAAAAGAGLDVGMLRQWLRMGFDDRAIAHFSGLGPRGGLTPRDVRARRLAAGLRPTYKCVDTCAGEFPAGTPYFYGTYEDEDEVPRAQTRTAVVLGSGPIRIGQGIEFDYCTVHAVQALKQAGWEAVVINNNPETVSTDFDLPDRLYVEPLTPEDVRAVVEREGAQGVLVQFGGQTPLNAAMPLARAGVRVLGTAPESLDISEDRRKFAALLHELNIPQPSGWTATTLNEAVEIGEREGLPLLVRPSYVLGGRGMIIARAMDDLRDAAAQALAGASGPVLLDCYLEGLEVELDAVADGTNLLIPALMEQVERAGVHSGDSLALLPARSVSAETVRMIVDYASRVVWALQVRGFLNIQFVIWRAAPYVLEVNLRASRTVPFVSKATGIPLVRLATEVMLGRSLTEFGYAGITLQPPPARWAVKAPVFSTGKLFGADPLLGPEMRSTGEVMGTGLTPAAALRRAFVAAGFPPEPERTLLLSVADRDKAEAAEVAVTALAQGFSLLATPGTAAACAVRGARARIVDIHQALSLVRSGKIGVLVNTPTRGYRPERPGFTLRRAASELQVPTLTSLDSARAMLEAFAPSVDTDLVPLASQG